MSAAQLASRFAGCFPERVDWRTVGREAEHPIVHPDGRCADVRELWPLLAARVPAFEAIKMSRAWAGFYDYNYLDQNGIIGRHPELENLYFCTGFSGHGIQQSAAAGRAMMELITGGAYQSLDLSRLGYERILSGHPLREINII